MNSGPTARRAAARPNGHAEDASVDRTELMERLGGDRALFADVIAIFLDDCPRRLAAIERAVDQADARLIEETAHVVKGAAANLSAARLFDAALTLERIGAAGQLRAAAAAWQQLAAEAALVMRSLREFSHERSMVEPGGGDASPSRPHRTGRSGVSPRSGRSGEEPAS